MEKIQTINSLGNSLSWMSEVRCDHVTCKEDFWWTYLPMQTNMLTCPIPVA
jgi:hypothetical protein